MAGRKTAVQASLYFLFPVKFLNPIHPGRHSGKNQIHKREGGHGLHNNHGPGHNHRIMAAFDMDQNILPVLIYGFLFGKNGGTRQQPRLSCVPIVFDYILIQGCKSKKLCRAASSKRRHVPKI